MGRASFSYITGEVPASFRRFGEEQIRTAGKLLRAFHDATRGLSPVDGEAVVCHGDPGPNNTVFRGGLPVAFIDFDLSAPGDLMQDLGYMAWTWCVSAKPERGPISFQGRQIRVLLEGYGLPHNRFPEIVDAILERHDWNICFWSQGQDKFLENGFLVPSPERISELVEWTRNERSFVTSHRAAIMGALK